MVQDTDPVRIENCKGRTDPAFVGRIRNVTEQGIPDRFDCQRIAGIHDVKLIPKKASDTAVAVPPGEFCSIRKFLKRLRIRTCPQNFFAHFMQAMCLLRVLFYIVMKKAFGFSE